MAIGWVNCACIVSRVASFSCVLLLPTHCNYCAPCATVTSQAIRGGGSPGLSHSASSSDAAQAMTSRPVHTHHTLQATSPPECALCTLSHMADPDIVRNIAGPEPVSGQHQRVDAQHPDAVRACLLLQGGGLLGSRVWGLGFLSSLHSKGFVLSPQQGDPVRKCSADMLALADL